MSDSLRDDLNEQELAQQTLQALQGEGDARVDDPQTFELGQRLRESALHALPESNSELRELLQTQSYEEVKTLSPPSSGGSSSRLWRLSAVAASLLCCFGLGYFLFRDNVYVATRFEDAIPQQEAKPEVVYRMETRTNQVPTTKMRTETRTRQVPVTRTRTEIKSRQLADGTSESYEIAVPHQELSTQSYQVQVPYTENVTQSYAVPVPYTPNGKEIAKEDYGKYGVDLSRAAGGGRSDGQRLGEESESLPSVVMLNGQSKLTEQPKAIEREKVAQALQQANGRSQQQGWNKEIQFQIADREDQIALGYIDGDGEGKSSGEQYNPILENRFTPTSGQSAISTFSIDVDTASYSNMRRFLNSHRRPPVDSIRIEELVNYFSYDYPQPKGKDPFSVNMEMATCPWNESHQLLRVGLKGKEIHVQERPATNVVYLIDVSGSMQNHDKLPLLKSGFQMLSRQLGENDRVSIVTYAGNAGVVLEPTSGEQTKTITQAIEGLSAGGSTHGSAGIELAYELAQQNFIEGGVNKVMLATDGDLNVGVTGDGALVDLIKQKASEGVFLTVLGFGTGNIKDGKLEQLADNGNGHYAYIDNTREAHRVLVEQLSASLVTIAKDVKIQVEFNPAEVQSYRLIGYENRALAAKDFDDDRKDAGEIGAGHSVTAIYEIQPAGAQGEVLSVPNGMKYQQAEKKEAPPIDAGLSDAAKSGELATLALRYKQPDANESKRIEFVFKNEDRSFPSASDDFRFAVSVAGFGMWLRNSEYLGDANLEMLLAMASASVGEDTSGYRSEFVDLIRKAISIHR